MNDLAASRTALITSLMRARHTRLDPDPVLDDPWGDRLVPESAIAEIHGAALTRLSADERAAAGATPRAVIDEFVRKSSVYSNVILRSRYAEDALREAVARGITQYVLIGAGFDSFVLRRPDYARDLQIFELDHPATQGLKRRRIAENGVVLPDSVHFVAADLARESLGSALERSVFRANELTFFSWLGVTVYLTRDANLAALRGIATSAPSRSEVVFTYMDERAFDPAVQSEGFRQLLKSVAASGEPFLSGFDPGALGDDLRACGLALAQDLDGPQLVERYGLSDSPVFRSSTASHIALAVVDR
jgi:methyltransferase (TIGR00027 family)